MIDVDAGPAPAPMDADTLTRSARAGPGRAASQRYENKAGSNPPPAAFP